MESSDHVEEIVIPIANVHAAWIAMLLGGIAGTIQGVYFHREAWLGGYGSWRRRMLRLGHVSFFGLGLINLCFALSVSALGLERGTTLPSRLLLLGLVSMPAVCYLSAIRPGFRHLFAIPVLSVLGGIGVFLWRLLTP